MEKNGAGGHEADNKIRKDDKEEDAPKLDVKIEEGDLQSKAQQQSVKVTINHLPVLSRRQMKKMKIDILKNGDTIESFTVIGKIADGGFGQIYKAIDANTKMEVALKIELITPKSDDTEHFVLQKFQGHRNCPVYFGSGSTKTFMFLAMQLMGKNLSDLRKACPLTPPRFSISAAYRTTFQCLKAIESLHSIGFIHRDIKPSNFAIGRQKYESSIVYLLDFGLCRQYVASDGSLKPSRNMVGFRGTVRYASLNAHLRKDLSRQDDLWSLFYTFYELLTGSIPWRGTNDKEIVAKLKTDYPPERMSKNISHEIMEFVDEIQRLQFLDKPDYDAMYHLLEKYLQEINVNMDDAYDWHILDCRALIHWTPEKTAGA